MSAQFPAGLTLISCGCLSLYLASPHQHWRARPLSKRPACIAGCLLIASGTAIAIQGMQSVAGVFAVLTWIMLLLVVLPYLAAAVRLRSERR